MIHAFSLLMSLALGAPVVPHKQHVANVGSPVHRSLKLEGMTYDAARKIILGYGWKPVVGRCEFDEDICALFPEIESCSDVDPGYCAMVFVKGNRCLYLGTSGGAPQRAGDYDTHVIDVKFKRSPCRKYN
ncbi:MAG TPA: hypothetical protein VGF77_10510 [Allosphingosinicella sp.]|jgi:hypothetical protein